MADHEDKKELDESNAGDKEGHSQAGSSKKKLIIIVIAAVVVLGGAVGGVLFSGVLSSSKKEDSSSAKHEKAATENHGDKKGKNDKTSDRLQAGPGNVFYYDMDEFIVNLNTAHKQQSFLKMKIALELPDDAQVAAIEDNMLRIRDIFQIYLRELRQEDLRGSAGMYHLRQELLLRLNKIVYPAKVNDILFREFFVQ
ncbi:MAG: flagellar basal body-associated FliL family protein [Alphaproteobacteria bacterium]|nr:flagellar basal body-associated FliL family protein [Alphaproteobacteria bacterium]